jgi:protein SCO1/2
MPTPTEEPPPISTQRPAKATPPESPGDLPALGKTIQARLAAIVANPLAWVLIILSLFSIPLSLTMAKEVPKTPDLKLQLPPFELTDQRGQPYSLDKLRGRVWVADFIFLSCPTVCPKLTKRMVEIQHRSRHLGDAFHLVTFTVDPENDTPERLAAYAHANKASPGRWTFLTGSLASIESTVIKGFKMAMGKEETNPGLFSIFHGERLVLVDQDGQIRGYYEATDEGVTQLLHDTGILVNTR